MSVTSRLRHSLTFRGASGTWIGDRSMLPQCEDVGWVTSISQAANFAMLVEWNELFFNCSLASRLRLKLIPVCWCQRPSQNIAHSQTVGIENINKMHISFPKENLHLLSFSMQFNGENISWSHVAWGTPLTNKH